MEPIGSLINYTLQRLFPQARVRYFSATGATEARHMAPSSRVHQRVQKQPRFQDWIASRARSDGTPRERAIAWRALEILIERELNRKQKSLFDTPLDEDQLNDRVDSSVNNAAELFLAREFGLPYYYGPDRISRLASLNIQQFLGLGGEVFEESVAAELLRKPTLLPPRRQHSLMKKAAKAVWDDIPKRVRHGRELRRFLESVGKFAHWYTYRPSAPNDPGVSGTAIRMSERMLLLDDAKGRSTIHNLAFRTPDGRRAGARNAANVFTDEARLTEFSDIPAFQKAKKEKLKWKRNHSRIKT